MSIMIHIETTQPTRKEMTMESIILFADSNRGVYIPKHFAESVQREFVQGIELSLLDDLIENDIDHDHYWDIWAEVLDNCKLVKDGKTYSLHQDGDLWLIDYDNASEDELTNLLGE